MTSHRLLRHRHFLPLSLVCLAALAFAVGCSCGETESEQQATTTKTVEKPKPAPAPAKPEPELARGRSVREQLEAEVELPVYYPKDAPVYPGSRTSNVGWQSGAVSGVFSTTDGSDEVIAYMNENLPGQGWGNVTTTAMPTGSVVRASKSNRTLSVLVDRMDDEGRTVIIVAVDP